jgi:hypothetical protein
MIYSLDKVYHFSNKRGQNDQYMDWFSNGNKTIANQSGIRVRSFLNAKKLRIPYNIPSLIVLVSNNHEKSKSIVPWEPAEENENQGTLIYKGDSRKYQKHSTSIDARSKLEHTGNKHFRKVELLIKDNFYEWLPPILYFSSVSMGRYRFKGLFIPKKISSYYDDSPHVEKDNYKMHCHRLDENNVPLVWLRDRCQSKDIREFDRDNAPQSWLNLMPKDI